MRIAIAGFGIGGGAAAVGLAMGGHEVTVFEQAADPGPIGAGFLLQPSGQAVLARLGLLDEVAGQAWPIRTFHAAKGSDRTLIALRYDRRRAESYALGVARGVVFSALFDAANRHGVNVVPGVRVVDALETEAAVVPVDSEGRRLGTFDALVAADGARSVLRARIDPRSTFRPSTHVALWGLGDADRENPHLLRQDARGTAVLAGLLPVGPRTNAFFWGCRVGHLDDLKRAGFDALVGRVEDVLPDAVPVLRSIGSFDRLTVATFGCSTGRRRFTDRIVAIGDSAHAAPPHLGQGANLALLDALALANAFERDVALPAVFEAFRRERGWQDWRYATLGRALAPFFQSDHTFLGPLRDLALPIMGAMPPTRALMERVLIGRG